MSHSMVLDRDTAALIAVVDEYQTLTYTRQWQDVGSFSLRINRYTSDAQYLGIDRVFVPDAEHSDQVYLIEQVVDVEGEDGRATDYIEVSGRSLSGYMEERIVIPPSGSSHDVQSAVPGETAIKHYVDEHMGPGADAARQIPSLTVEPSAGLGSTVSVQGRFQTVLGIAKEIGAVSGLGWQIALEREPSMEYQFDVIPGVDRSGQVVLSPELDTVSSIERLYSRREQKTWAYVAGQGEGVDREIVTRPASAPTGFDRREVFRDARDIPVGETATLQARGDATLAESAVVSTLRATMQEGGQYRYLEDWDLGDIVRVVSEDWDLDEDQRVWSVTVEINQDRAIPLVSVELGNPWPTLTNKIVKDAVGGDGRVDYPLGGGVTDHGALTGLADNDHPQYVLAAGHSSHITDHGGLAGLADNDHPQYPLRANIRMPNTLRLTAGAVAIASGSDTTILTVTLTAPPQAGQMLVVAHAGITSPSVGGVIPMARIKKDGTTVAEVTGVLDAVSGRESMALVAIVPVTTAAGQTLALTVQGVGGTCSAENNRSSLAWVIIPGPSTTS